MKNPLKSGFSWKIRLNCCFARKADIFMRIRRLEHKIWHTKYKLGQISSKKILKFGRASRAQECFSLFSGRRALSDISTFIVWHIKSFETFLLCYSEFGQNIFLPRFYSGNLSYRCFQGSGKVSVFPIFLEFEEIPRIPACNSLHEDIPRIRTLEEVWLRGVPRITSQVTYHLTKFLEW